VRSEHAVVARVSAAARVLVVNTGSSSLKYQLIDPGTGEWVAKGLAERIGEDAPRLHHETSTGSVVEREADLPDHAAALTVMLQLLGDDTAGLLAVGHRVVHGGSEYREPVVVDDAVEETIERLIPLAPLHNPAGLLGIRELRRLLRDVPHVAVFDTAFHSTMPAEAYTYAIPVDLAERLHIRKYGFHGTSYRYVTRRAAEFLGIAQARANLIVCHLGNGASMAAIRNGDSVDTTMGLTPLQGLAMGTRSGDLDPAVILHLVRVGGMSLDEADALLNKASGLKGMAGTQDMREVRALADAGDEAARRAIAVYAYRIRGYVGAYLATVPDVAALVFTAGIGEHDAALRRDVCLPLAHLGIRLDEGLNAASGGEVRAIDNGTGPIRILVVPTNEEAEIARQAAEAVERADRA
jgi:acetate kinase